MDAIFGKKNFRNEIIWRRGVGVSRSGKARYQRNHDCLLFYSKLKNDFNKQYKPYNHKTISMYKFDDEDGRGKYRLQVLRTYGAETIKKFKKDNRIIKLKSGKSYLKQYLKENK